MHTPLQSPVQTAAHQQRNVFPQHLTRTILGPLVDMRATMQFDWQSTEALDAPEKLPSGGTRAVHTTVGLWFNGFAADPRRGM